MNRTHLPSKVVLSLLAFSMLVLAALGSGCGGSNDAGAESPQSSKASAPSFGPGQTGAVLQPVDGSDASGTALILKKHPTSAAHFKVRLEGLEPNTNGGQYVVWLMASRHKMVPLYSYPVGKNGVFAHTWLPNPLHVSFIEDGSKTEFMVTRANNADEKEQTLEGGATAYDPPFIGESVLRGTFTGPLVGTKPTE